MASSIPAPPGRMVDARARLDSLTKPPGSLGVLEDIAARVATIQGTPRPSLARKRVVVMAADHGVASQGVTPYPSEVTAQMVANFASEGAAVNQLASWAQAEVVVVDIGVSADMSALDGIVHAKVRSGTADMSTGPAMSRAEALAAVDVGVRLAQKASADGVDVVAIGEMGIGNTTAAAALTCVFTGKEAQKVVGPGTGLDRQGVMHKTAIVDRALVLNEPVPADPFGALAAVGGLEIAGLVGVVIGCASRGLPVVSDGYISGVAAMVAAAYAPRAEPFIFPSHLSTEPGHRAVLTQLGLRPVLDLDMRLGEGTGAVLAMGIMDAACTTMSGMATFEQAGVSDREEP